MSKSQRFSLFIVLLLINSLTHAEEFEWLTPDVEPHYKPAEEVEAGFWLQVDDIEKKVKNSPHRIRDEALNQYVEQMVCRLAQEYCGDIRVYIMRQPYFNASMYPNGMMIVWSGLLLRVENQDQLATVLGHEIGHYLRRHSMKRFLDIKNKSTFRTLLSFGLAVSGVGYLNNITDIMLMASIFAHSRDHEHEADKYGIQLLHQAGYEVDEAAKVWDNLIAEDKAAKIQNKRGMIFFATHPAPDDRSDRLSDYAEQLSQSAKNNADEEALFLDLKKKHIYSFLRDQIMLNQPGRSIYLLNELEKKQRNLGVIYYFQGETYRQRKEDGDLDKAEQAYLTALKYDDAPVETYRDLGILSLKLKKSNQAKQYLQSYLAQAENAKDREMIEFYLSMEM